MCRSVSAEVRGQPRDWVFSFFFVDSEDGTQFLRLGGKLLDLLRISQEYGLRFSNSLVFPDFSAPVLVPYKCLSLIRIAGKRVSLCSDASSGYPLIQLTMIASHIDTSSLPAYCFVVLHLEMMFTQFFCPRILWGWLGRFIIQS